MEKAPTDMRPSYDGDAISCARLPRPILRESPEPGARLRVPIAPVRGRSNEPDSLQSLETPAMRSLILLALLTSPALIGSIAVVRLEGSSGFVLALAVSLVLLREAILICMILMRRWQLYGREIFLIEQNGRHRWVDAFELKSMPEPCRVRAQEFRPHFMRPPRRQ